jgi:hypothetical protein
MKPRTRNILIIVGIVVLIVFGFVGYGIYSLYSFFSQVREFTNREIPAELKETGVLKGADFLTKSEFFKLKETGFTETIGKGAAAKDEKERQKIINSNTAKGIFGFDDIKICGEEIVAVGKFGAQVFDLNGNFKQEILFEPNQTKIKVGWYEQNHYKNDLDNLQIIDLENDGRCEFFSFGLTQGMVVYGNQGNIIWKYGENEITDLFEKRDIDKEIYVTEATVGDLDGDGAAEYIVARRNDGIRVFDRNGGEKWFQPEEFPTASMKVLDIDGDGKNELLEYGGKSKIRDASGNVIRELKGGSSNNAVLFVEDKDKRKTLIFCNIYQNKFTCEDENDQKIIESEAPLSDIPKKNPKKVEVPGYPEMSYMDDKESVSYPKAVLVSLRKDKPKYLAVVASFIGIPRAVLRLRRKRKSRLSRTSARRRRHHRRDSGGERERGNNHRSKEHDLEVCGKVG